MRWTGLRKLRRQATSEAFLNLPPEELIDSEPEELDDIDKVGGRDGSKGAKRAVAPLPSDPWIPALC